MVPHQTPVTRPGPGPMAAGEANALAGQQEGNNTLIKFVKRGAGIVALAVAALAVPAGVANAATNPNTPQSVCGSRYTDVVDHFDVPGGGGVTTLLYNPSNGHNCAVTIKISSIGAPTMTGVFLTTSTTTRDKVDSGNFSYFAGPVYLYAPNTCVCCGGETSMSGGWWSVGSVGCN